MKKNRGITLIEILIAVGVLVVVLLLCVLMLYGASKEGRDVKRVSDIGVLRSSLAAVKVQYGSYQEAGCQVGAVSSCQEGKLVEIMPTIKNFKDPKGTVLCGKNCSGPCQYSIAITSSESYEVLFYLEKGIGNYKDKGCYQLTEAGIKKK